MATVKNTARGPRGLRTKDGNLVMIEAGQSAEGDFDASEVSDFKAALKAEAAAAPENEDDEAVEEGGEGESAGASSASRRSRS